MAAVVDIPSVNLSGSTGTFANAAANNVISQTVRTIDERVPTQGRSDKPTLASQPRGTPVLQSITYADPNGAAAIVRQAAQRMLMLSMMGNVTSPNGLRNIMAGSLGGMFQNLINQYGIGPIVGMLNNVMPGIGSALGNTLNYALEMAISNAMRGNKTGVYSQTSLQATSQSLAAIAAINAAANATEQLTSQAATLGGAALGLDVGSLAATIAAAAVGTNIKQTVTIGENVIDLNVYVSSNDLQLSVPAIPSLKGNEHITLADLTTAALTEAIIREIKLAGNPKNLTQQQFVNIVKTNYSSAQNNGLKLILGYGLSQLLNNVTSLVFSGSGQMYRPPTDTYFRTLLNPGYITQSRIQSARNIALSRFAYDTANMFLNSPFMSGSDMAYGLVNQVAKLAIGQSLQMQYRGLVYTAIRRL